MRSAIFCLLILRIFSCSAMLIDVEKDLNFSDKLGEKIHDCITDVVHDPKKDKIYFLAGFTYAGSQAIEYLYSYDLYEKKYEQIAPKYQGRKSHLKIYPELRKLLQIRSRGICIYDLDGKSSACVIPSDGNYISNFGTACLSPTGKYLVSLYKHKHQWGGEGIAFDLENNNSEKIIDCNVNPSFEDIDMYFTDYDELLIRQVNSAMELVVYHIQAQKLKSMVTLLDLSYFTKNFDSINNNVWVFQTANQIFFLELYNKYKNPETYLSYSEPINATLSKNKKFLIIDKENGLDLLDLDINKSALYKNVLRFKHEPNTLIAYKKGDSLEVPDYGDYRQTKFTKILILDLDKALLQSDAGRNLITDEAFPKQNIAKFLAKRELGL